MRVKRSIKISAPPDRIWPFLVEPDKILQWHTRLRRFEYTGERRSGIGATFCWEEDAHGPPIELNFEVTEWIENERLAFSTPSTSGIQWYQQSWALEAISCGSRFTFVEELGLPFGAMSNILGMLARPHEIWKVWRMLVKLKSLAEA